MGKVKRYQNKNKNRKKLKFNFHFRVLKPGKRRRSTAIPSSKVTTFLLSLSNHPSLLLPPRKWESSVAIALSLALSHFPPLSEHTCLYYQSLALPSPPWKWTRNTFTRFSIPPSHFLSLPLSHFLSLSFFLACTSKFLWRTFEDATAVTPSTWLSNSGE
jgi:hypothetical protein